MKPQHKRMQSIQTGSVGRLSDSLERRSPEKGLRTPRLTEYEEYRKGRSLERSPTRVGSNTPTPTGKVSAHQSTTENNQPLPAMLALQSVRNRQEVDTPLADITNGQSSSTQPSMSFDALSSQILGLTSIATNLQREMANLSRRSKDNATDLVSLKEATNSRDEDIRKSLHELMSGLDEKFSTLDTKLLTDGGRSSNIGYYLDNKAHDSPLANKTFTLPRISSPAFSAAMDRGLTASPSMVSADGAASIALLEKVLREMATREFQERIMGTLDTVKSQALVSVASDGSTSQRSVDPTTTAKLEEILASLKDMKENSGSRALVKAVRDDNGKIPSQIDLYLDNDRSGRAPPVANTGSDAINDEIKNMMKSVKQSLSQGGGLTNEVKALVRELRGEVLGMGREIARKLEQAESTSHSSRPDAHGPGREEIAEIVQQGLADLREQMHQVLQENRRQSSELTKATIDTNQVVLAVQGALAGMPRSREEPTRDAAAEREELLGAIREAWEDCKPEIALEHFGLERDEILDTLKEGLSSYQPKHPDSAHTAIGYEDVLDAVQKGLANFQPPQVRAETGATREEIMTAVRECLDSFEWPAQPSAVVHASQLEMTRDDILSAVQEGMSGQMVPARDLDLTRNDLLAAVHEGLAQQAPVNREDVFDAIKSCLEGEQNPLGGMGERVIEAMHEFHGSMKTEFQQYSAANGKDTEQVLDALKDGIEDIRSDIKSKGHGSGNDETSEPLLLALKEAVEDLRADIGDKEPGNAQGNVQLLLALKDAVEELRNDMGNRSAGSLADVLKDGLEDLRGDIESYVDRAADVTGKDEIIDSVKAGFAAMQADLDKQQAPNTPELLEAMEKEFEHLRDSISKSLARSNGSSDKDDILDAIRDMSDDRQSSLSGNSEDIVRLVKEELEHMRLTLAGTLVRGGDSGGVDKDEILTAIREGLDSHRSLPKTDGAESIFSNTSELLDAFNDGVEQLKADMQKLSDRPLDISTNYEILDTLKTGLEDVRADIQLLHGKQSDASSGSTSRGQEVVVHDENMISTQIEDLKVMIGQLRIKIEAMDVPVTPAPMMPAENRLHKDDLDDIHAAIQEVHNSVSSAVSSAVGMATSAATMAREPQEVRVEWPASAASKDDVDALETLLRNVKAQLDELVMPDVESMARTAHLEAVEEMLKDVKTGLEDTAAKVAEPRDKEDFTIIELTLKDVASSIEDLKSKVAASEAEEGGLKRTDIELVESLCLDIKSSLETFAPPDFEKLSSKEDVADVKNSIQAFREQFETTDSMTGQAFEARKTEHAQIAIKIDDVKCVIGDLRDELMGKLDGSEEGIHELNKVLGMHHENTSTYATATSVSELSEVITKELGKHMEHHVISKTEMEERDSTLFTKHEETSAELKDKIEEKFNELMTKYDDAQIANEIKLSALEERDKAHLEATSGTKGVVDDLRLLMDTLGSTVSETCERITEDSKTVFTGVDQIDNKIGNLHAANAHEHGLTRDEVAKTLATATRLEGSLQEHQPALLAAIRDVLALVQQNYEHSQQQTENFARATEEIKTGVNSIPSSIPSLFPALPEAPAEPSFKEVHVQNAYDDSQVHDKLNNLIAQAANAKEAFGTLEGHHRTTHDSLANMEKLEKLDRLDVLDGIHDQVVNTAAEISSMVSTQARLMAEHHQSKAAEATEAAIALEKRVAQKEKVESDILSLTTQKDALIESMAALRREQEELSSQTKKLTREVGKLETALTIRQEEMREMNSRAEGLERRILEGVMNHARSVNLAKPARRTKMTPAERDASMSLKRVPSTASGMTSKTSIKDGGSAIGSAVEMALKKRGALAPSVNAVSSRASGVDRRILSTSQLTGNRGVVVPDRSIVLAPTPKSGLVSLKRSHSVKSNTSAYLSGRKPSWTGPDSSLADKENYAQSDSMEEDDHSDDASSDTGTERRTSIDGSSLMYTDSLAYGTGSDLSTSTNARSLSYASSVGTGLKSQADSILEEDEDVETPTVDHMPAPHENDKFGIDVEQENESNQIMALLGPPSLDSEFSQDGPLAMTTYEGRTSDVRQSDGKYYAPSDSGIGSEPSWTPGIMQGTFDPIFEEHQD